MKRHLTLTTIIIITFLALGCSEPKGPAEKAGEKIDQTINKGKNMAEEANDEAAKTIEKAGNSMKK